MNIHINQPCKADIFATLFQHIKLFTEHVNIMFQYDKMYIQAMDSSRVSIFEIHLPSSWFDVYTNTNESGTTLGINSSLLFKVLNTRDSSQSLHIRYDEDDDDKLFFEFTGGSESKSFDKHFEIPLLDIDSETMNIPAIEYQAEFSIPSAHFASLINQLKLFGDTMQIECSEDKIQLSSHSGDMGKMFVEIPIDDLTSFAIEEDQNLNISFSLVQLHNICAYSKLSRDVEINMTSNFPIKLTYALGKVPEEDGAQIVYYLAPKIGDE